MISAGAGDAAGKYLCSFTCAVTEPSDVFIIYMTDLVFAKDADFLFSADGAFLERRVGLCFSIKCHDEPPKIFTRTGVLRR